MLFISLNALLFAQQKQDSVQSLSGLENRLPPKEYLSNTVLPLIHSGFADSAQHLVQNKLLGDQDKVALADAFYHNEHYDHAAHWLQDLYRRYPNQELRNSLVICLQKAGVKQFEDGDFREACETFQQASLLQPNDPGLYHAAALARLRSGEWQDVETWINKGLAIDPGHEGLLQLQKIAFINKGDYESLEKQLLQQLEERPRDVNTVVELAKLYFDSGRTSEAIKRLTDFEATYPGHAPVYQTLALVYKKSGKPSEERQIYKKWLAMKPAADSLMLKIAETWEREKEWARARNVYSDYWNRHPDNEQTALRIASLLGRESKIDSALAFYEKRLPAFSEPAVIFARAGKLAFSNKRYDKALDYYQRWHHLDPQSAEPLVEQGKIYEEMQNRDQALQSYEKAERCGGSLYSAYRLWTLYQQQETSEQAEALRAVILRRSLQALSDIEAQAQQMTLTPAASPMIMTGRQITFQIKADSLKSILRSVVNEWINNDPDDLKKELATLAEDFQDGPILYELYGDIERARHHYTAAIEYYSKALEREPGSIDIQEKLAHQLNLNGEPDKAFRLYLAAADRNPQKSSILSACRELAEKLDQLAFLAGRWERYLRAHPDQDVLRTHLISVWNLLGRNDKVMALRNREKNQKMKDNNDETIE